MHVRASGVVFCKSVNSLVFSLSCFLTKPKGQHTNCNMHKPDLHFLCFLLSQQKSWETKKCEKWSQATFNPFQPGVFDPKPMRHHNWHWTNSRPEILYPFPCEGPNRHAKPQEKRPYLPFVNICYMLFVASLPFQLIWKSGRFPYQSVRPPKESQIWKP